MLLGTTLSTSLLCNCLGGGKLVAEIILEVFIGIGWEELVVLVKLLTCLGSKLVDLGCLAHKP